MSASITWPELVSAPSGTVVAVVLRGREVRFTKDSRGEWISQISGARVSHGKLARWGGVAVDGARESEAAA